MLADKKLTKAADDLYLEPYKDGEDFKWVRKLELLWIDLVDVSIVKWTSVDSPEFPLSDEYKEERDRYLTATGLLKNRTIRLINKEGELAGHFESVNLSLRPFDRQEEDAEKTYGSIFYMDEEIARWEGRRSPYVAIELHVPRHLVEATLADIEEQRYRKIRLMVYVDVFQSETQRSLAESYMHQDYCIEEDGSSAAHFYHIYVDNVASSPNFVAPPSDDDWDEEEEEELGDKYRPVQPIEEIRDLIAVCITTLDKVGREVRGTTIVLFLILVALLLQLL